MIPKTIHYCWFGGKEIPSQYRKYMESWSKFMPGYEIKRWDESNFDVHCIPYCSEAYSAGRMAFVSDYARLRILYEHGGVYFDTDVELIRPLDDIISKGSFMGFEKNSNANDGEVLGVNVGLGFAIERHHPILKEILEQYNNRHFIKNDGTIDQTTIVVIVTDVLKRFGLNYSKQPVTLNGITVYPWDYFCPIEFMSNKMEITENTRTIHHFSASWMSKKHRILIMRGYYLNKLRKFLGIRR